MTQQCERDKVDTTPFLPPTELWISQLSKWAQGLDYPESVGEWLGKGSKKKDKQAFCYKRMAYLTL